MLPVVKISMIRNAIHLLPALLGRFPGPVRASAWYKHLIKIPIVGFSSTRIMY